MYYDIPMLRAEEKIRDRSGISVRYITNNKKKTSAFHWHNYYTIDIIIDGIGEHCINGKTQKIKRGNVCLIKPADIHQVSGNNLSFYSLRFSYNAIPEQYREIVQNIQGGFIASEDILNRFITYMNAMIDYNTVLSNLSDNMFATQALQMNFALILILISEKAPTLINRNNIQITSLLNWLGMHFMENPTVKESASIAGLSPSYFPSWFKKNTGISYTEHLFDLRMSYARTLLKIGFSITDACFSSGFGSLSHFNHIFKRKYGITPREYQINEKQS